MRICSTLPSGTEILYGLGLGDQVYGVSHACDYPPEACAKPVVVHSAFDSQDRSSLEIDRLVQAHQDANRGIYELDAELLQSIRPDLLVTQELCEVCALSLAQVMRAVQGISPQPEVLSLAPTGVEGVLEDIVRVGEHTGRQPEARGLVQALRERIAAVSARVESAAQPRVVCLEWLDPPMCGGHWVPEMVEMAGGVEVLGRRGEDSRAVSWDEMEAAAPEVLVLMPCGFDVDRILAEAEVLRRDQRWQGLAAVSQGRVHAVHANAYFSRPGPRLVDGIELLAALLHPQLFPPPSADRAAAVASS